MRGCNFSVKDKTRQKWQKWTKYSKNREIFYHFLQDHSHACNYRMREKPKVCPDKLEKIPNFMLECSNHH